MHVCMWARVAASGATYLEDDEEVLVVGRDHDFVLVCSDPEESQFVLAPLYLSVLCALATRALIPLTL